MKCSNSLNGFSKLAVGTAFATLFASTALLSTLLSPAIITQKTAEISFKTEMFTWLSRLNFSSPQIEDTGAPTVVRTVLYSSQAAPLRSEIKKAAKLKLVKSVKSQPKKISLAVPQPQASESELLQMQWAHSLLTVENVETLELAPQVVAIQGSDQFKVTTLPENVQEIMVPAPRFQRRAARTLATQTLVLKQVVILEESKPIAEIRNLAENAEVVKKIDPSSMEVLQQISQVSQAIVKKPRAKQVVIQVEKPTVVNRLQNIDKVESEELRALPAKEFPGFAAKDLGEIKPVPSFLQESLMLDPPQDLDTQATEASIEKNEYSESTSQITLNTQNAPIVDELVNTQAQAQRVPDNTALKSPAAVSQVILPAQVTTTTAANENGWLPFFKKLKNEKAVKAKPEAVVEEAKAPILSIEKNIESSQVVTQNQDANELELISIDNLKNRIHAKKIAMVRSENENVESLAQLNGSHWIVADADGYQSALALVEPNNKTTHRIPLISRLATIMMGDLQTDLGIVYGKLAKNYEIAFTGRHQQIVYLDHQWQILQNLETSELRRQAHYFLIVNADPGLHLLSISQKQINEDRQGALAVPVMSGKATYLDLSDIQVQNLHVTVMDASSEESHGLGQIRTTILGNSGAGGFSDSQGNATLKNAVFIGHYPLFIETEDRSGFKHRYQFTRAEIKDLGQTPLMLYRFGENQILNWTGQLAGGVSPQSGLLVAALPQLAAQFTGNDLFPVLRHLFEDSGLTPETYILEEDGQLSVGTPLHPQHARMIGAQLAEGMQILQLENEKGQILWRHFTVSSPGVVNVVGP